MGDHPTESRIREIYAETIDALYGYASRKCGGDRQLAEDVTQETWLRAVREWRRSGIPRTPLAWLTVVARNLLFNHFRRLGRAPIAHVSADELLAAVDTGRVSESSDTAAMVSCALAKLPSAQVQLLEAFHFEGMNVAEMARGLGLSERAVEGRLRRARERLRREIEAVLRAQGELI
jgi:RNA polymerase sigma-70 factor (ECF subfamily)